MSIPVTGNQLRMARNGLRLSVRELAADAGVSANSVVNIETKNRGHHDTFVALQTALVDAGAEFEDGWVRVPEPTYK